MASRKIKVVSMDRADSEGKQWVMQFSRPINSLVVEGIVALINAALAD